MKNIHLILILIVALWNVLPGGSSSHPLFDLIQEDPTSGGVTTNGDPETDPIVITLPPPR